MNLLLAPTGRRCTLANRRGTPANRPYTLANRCCTLANRRYTPTPHCRAPTPHCRTPTPHCRTPMPHCRAPANRRCRLANRRCRLANRCCRLSNRAHTPTHRRCTPANRPYTPANRLHTPASRLCVHVFRALLCTASLSVGAAHTAAWAGDDSLSSDPPPQADRYAWSVWTPCHRCRIWLGVGGTYAFWNWSDGLVIPLTFEADGARWELGAFRMARPQRAPHAPAGLAAPRFWGFSAMHRWQILHRGSGKLYVGLGAAYVTQENYVNSSLWNFAYLVGYRYQLGAGRRACSVAHRASVAFFPTARAACSMTRATASG
jgi:hypothetical protein